VFLTFASVDKALKCHIRIKATKQYFSVVPFVSRCQACKFKLRVFLLLQTWPHQEVYVKMLDFLIRPVVSRYVKCSRDW